MMIYVVREFVREGGSRNNQDALGWDNICNKPPSAVADNPAINALQPIQYNTIQYYTPHWSSTFFNSFSLVSNFYCIFSEAQIYYC